MDMDRRCLSPYTGVIDVISKQAISLFAVAAAVGVLACRDDVTSPPQALAIRQTSHATLWPAIRMGSVRPKAPYECSLSTRVTSGPNRFAYSRMSMRFDSPTRGRPAGTMLYRVTFIAPGAPPGTEPVGVALCRIPNTQIAVDSLLQRLNRFSRITQGESALAMTGPRLIASASQSTLVPLVLVFVDDKRTSRLAGQASAVSADLGTGQLPPISIIGYPDWGLWGAGGRVNGGCGDDAGCGSFFDSGGGSSYIPPSPDDPAIIIADNDGACDDNVPGCRLPLTHADSVLFDSLKARLMPLSSLYLTDERNMCAALAARLQQMLDSGQVFRGNPLLAPPYMAGSNGGGSATRGSTGFHLDSFLLDSAELSPNPNWKSTALTAALHETAHVMSYTHSNVLVFTPADYPFEYLNYNDAQTSCVSYDVPQNPIH